jgi:peptidoglycan/LPS O-acetylase OafA/YrhL
MAAIRTTFAGFPESVRRANLFLWTSWTSHCYFVYLLFSGQTAEFPTNLFLQQIAIGMTLGVFVFMVKRWARILGMLFNVAAIGLYVLVAILFYTSRPSITFLAIVNIGLFCASIYYLLSPRTARFFTSSSHTDEQGDGIEPRPGTVHGKPATKKRAR